MRSDRGRGGGEPAGAGGGGRGADRGRAGGGGAAELAAAIRGRLEELYLARVRALPDDTRTLLLLLAAADPTGTPGWWRAAGQLGPRRGGDAAADPGRPVRHPGAVPPSADPVGGVPVSVDASRHRAHRALADVTDQWLDPDRRAWHRARAAPGPDEDVAAELARSAERAQARGGLGAAAAFLKEAATLTIDPGRRAGRALAAAQAKLQAGVFDVARDLLAMAESGPLSDTQQANVDVMRAQLAFNTSRGGEAPALLLNAAKKLEMIDSDLSRATYLDALLAAIFAGRLAGPGGDVLEVARAVSAAPPPRHPRRASDLLLDGTAAGLHAGYAAGVPHLRKALADIAATSADDELRWMYLACITATRLWDDERWLLLSERYLHLARSSGALGELPLALTARAHILLFTGDLAAAAALTDEMQAVTEATGTGLAPYGAMGLAALRGDEARATALIDATIQDATRRGEGIGITFAEWAKALLNNGLGHYRKAGPDRAAGLR